MPWRRRSMHPVVFPPIPRPASIVAAPVVADTERHDADPQTRTELDDGNAAVLIIEEQKITVDPAAVTLPVHIAPSPVVETTVHVQQTVGRQGENQRIVGARPGAQVHQTLGVCGAGPGGGAETDCGDSEDRKQLTSHNPPKIFV